jgi:tetratricopeptide (TPR) repeat protein
VKTLSLILLLCLAALPATAQNVDQTVNALLVQVDKGEIYKVRQEMPALLSKYPNHPGLLYVQARITTNGAEAVKIYQSIVDNFPKSEWADDALYRVYQFWYSIGLYRTADLKLQQLKRDYPSSPFLQVSAARDTTALPATPAREDSGTVLVTPGRPVQTESAAAGQFALQVGAFSTQANAERQKGQLEADGLEVEIVNKVKDGRSLFIVLVGSFPTYDAAKARSADLQKRLNTPSIVVTR